MEIDLREIEESCKTEDRIEIFRVFNDSLRNSAWSLDAKATSIVDSLARFRSSKDTLKDAANFIWEFWAMIGDLSRNFPPDHPWQQVLLGVVSDLRHRAEHSGNAHLADWADLSDFTIYLFDHWADPADFNPDYVNQNTGEIDVEIGQWVNLNSFVARFSGTLTQTDIQWTYLPVFQIRTALEDELENMDAKLVDCKVWVCTEWLLYNVRNLHVFLCDEGYEVAKDEPGKQRIGPNLTTGPLAKNIPPQSTQRWDFWIARLKDMAGRSEELDKRIEEATHQMEKLKAGASS